MSVWKELEQRVRSRGVRVEQRLALLHTLEQAEDQQPDALRRKIEELEQHIAQLGKRVREALR